MKQDGFCVQTEDIVYVALQHRTHFSVFIFLIARRSRKETEETIMLKE